MDALSREQAEKNGPGNGSQNPLQVLVRKAENGEMPVMTLAGLRKPSEVEAEKKREEQRERERNSRSEAEKAQPNSSVEKQAQKKDQKLPTSMLADLCRQGGGATLAEMVMTVSCLS